MLDELCARRSVAPCHSLLAYTPISSRAPYPPAKREIKTKRSPKQTKKTTNEVTSAGTQQVLARVTYGPVAAAPSSTHVRKSSPLSAASGVGVRGLPGLLFVESTAPKA